ncbi:MAG: zinc-ribbon domain-containing protein [Pseudomonadota bacterium]|nr:zinc-ribbon domain-containing protein [Pseudomonadota bacterium]
MSLATQCPSCTTAFRVVQDQLKISAGWVRCGQCDSVFNAFEGLFDLRDEPEGTTVHEEPPATSQTPATEADDYVDIDIEGTPSSLAELLADPIDVHLFGARKRADVARKPADYVGARDRIDFSDARFDSDLFADQTLAADAMAEATAGDDESALDPSRQPAFLRRAERIARWQSRPARIAIGGASTLALLLLLAQALHHYRDAIASDWPSTRAALGSWCRLVDCSLQAPRRINDIHVESTELARGPAPETYLLNLSLRNRSHVALRLPAIELSLTDSNGSLLSRRALSAPDFRTAEVIGADSEVALQALLATGNNRVAGYKVEIFYP